MKKICIITQCALPIPTVKGGAVETLVEYIIEKNEKAGKYYFTVISIADEKAEIFSQKYKYTDFIYINKCNSRLNKIRMIIYRVLKHIYIYIPFSGEFKRALKTLKGIKNNYDFFIFQAGPTTQIPAISRIVGKEKLLVHLHWDGMGTKRMAESCTRLIAISKYIAGRWKTCTKTEDNVVVLPNCVKTELFNKAVSENEKMTIRDKLGITEQEKVVLFVGRIVEAKGVRELIKAFETIKYKDAVLMIIGSSNFGEFTNTPYEQEVQQLIENSKKKIVFTGYIHQSELYKYYAIATCSVMPTQFQEPAGLVAIEAQATGTPLIVTNVGGLSEYCSKDSTIFVTKDENQVENLSKAIDTLLYDEKRCIIMKEKGIEFSSHLNSEQFFHNFVEIIDNL